MIGRPRHLHDEQLLELYLAQRHHSSMEASVAGHLDGCSECRARLSEVARNLDGLRRDAEAETDAIFTPDLLRAQQRHIANRLEHLTQSPRVIRFPVRLIGRRMASTARHIAPRWAVAAAAAGLFIGLGVGTLVAPAPSPAPAPVVVAPPIVVPPVEVNESSLSADDDVFLSELEMALSGPRNRELMIFDQLTPPVQAIRTEFR